MRAVNLRRIAICEQSTDHMGSGTNVAELKARQLKDVLDPGIKPATDARRIRSRAG